MLLALSPSLAACFSYKPVPDLTTKTVTANAIIFSLGYFYRVADHTTIHVSASQESLKLLVQSTFCKDFDNSYFGNDFLENWSACASLSVSNSVIADAFDRVKFGIKLRYSS